MNRVFNFTLAAALVALAPHAASAAGSSPRAWVSVAKGSDKAGCGPATSPCKTFQYALTNVVASGGAINVLDPGGYGPLNITFPVSVINDGVGTAGIFNANPSGNAVDINLASGGQVVLRGLSIDGGANSVQGNGVSMASAGNLTIINCTITGFVGPASQQATASISDRRAEPRLSTFRTATFQATRLSAYKSFPTTRSRGPPAGGGLSETSP